MAKRNTYYQDEVITGDKVDVKQLRRFLRYVIPYKKTFFFVLFLVVVSVAVSLLAPLLLRTVVDTVIPQSDYRMLILLLGGFVLAGGLEIVITFAHSKLMGKMGHNIIAEIRKDVFYKLQKLSFDYFDSRPAGKISVRVTDYINELADFFTTYLMNFISAMLKVLVVTVIMLVLSPLLTLAVYAVMIPLALCIFWLRRALRRLFRKHRAKNSNRTAFLVESLNGENIIKNYNRSDYNCQIYHDLQQDSAKTWMQIVRRNELNTPIVEFFWNAGTIFIYAFAFLAISKGWDISAGTVVTFLNFMTLCSTPFTQISMILQQLAQVSANLERVFETMDTPLMIADKEDAEDLEAVEGNIDFNDVTFAYEEGVNILEHFDLHVKKGETIALVGPTGAGKTTVINLITRFYDVCEGSVCIDGKDVRDIRLQSLRQKIGVLMQDPFVFKGTIMDNIRYGRRDATDEECIAAAKRIYADRFIEKFPDGYYHQIEESGTGLSAGEKQMISFARIMLRDPAVIILDEATSSVDSATEQLIQQVLDMVLKDKTAFVVAHRLSTIRKADRILYIADKGIAEQGSHAELMEQCGLYYKLNQKS